MTSRPIDVHNLCVINPLDTRRWSPRNLGSLLFPGYDHKFSEWTKAYTDESIVVPDLSHDDHAMEVDTPQDDSVHNLHQTDAFVLLHLQVIEIFVGLLKQLVAAHQRDLQRRAAEGASESMHAPTSIYALKRDENVSNMKLDVLLSWVQDSPSGRLSLQEENPPLTSFLSMPYQKHTGSRPGNEWSTQDWFVSLRKLRMIGQAWKEKGEDIVNILRQELLPHLQRVFGDDDLVT